MQDSNYIHDVTSDLIDNNVGRNYEFTGPLLASQAAHAWKFEKETAGFLDLADDTWYVFGRFFEQVVSDFFEILGS